MTASAKKLKSIGIVGNTDKQTQKIHEDVEVIISSLQGLLSEMIQQIYIVSLIVKIVVTI
jgi:hypothetical protein